MAGWDGEQDVQIGQVLKGSPAEAAGLLPGDLLISVNGQPIASAFTVQQAIIHSAWQAGRHKADAERQN